ncbi:glycosyltransferase family protein [Spirillospora sp. NBC_01491]|uniref:glycosyltransferase family protein n=1 Tax=Spirillospora sp. NBC_01491 TaxID=2976007 RepID=UPI002E308BA6|nr:glycosyltransferase [Spirillospora sp. NBC_01491]
MTETDPAELAGLRARGDLLAADNSAVRLRLAELENERDERDRQIARLTGALTDAARRIGDLDRERAAQEHRAELAEWQIAALATRRWARLGGALTAFRARPASPASFRRLRGALRAEPEPPEPPAERRPPRHPEVKVADTESLDVPAAEVPEGPVARPGLTAAVVLGPVLEASLRYEWRQVSGFGADDWREVFEAERPGLLLVEPVATGLPIADLARWCRDRGVPSVYWDTGPGLSADAALFDHVFTVDADAVPAHRERLGHDRVHALPFAAQPRLHNPVRAGDRGRYPLLYEGEYDAAAEQLIAPAPRLGAHFYGTGFPHMYRQRVVAPLPYGPSLAARKRYRLLLAPDPRRAVEAAAAGVPVVHHREPAASPAFGPVARDGKDASRLLRALLNGPELRDRQAHLAVRSVHEAHTYRHRIDTVLRMLDEERPGGEAHFAEAERPAVSLLLPTCRPEQIGPAIEQAARQTWRPLQLVLVLHGLGLDPADVEKRALAAGVDDVVVIAADRSVSLGGCLNLAIDAADGTHLGKIDDDELYGPHYLSDLLPAFSYTDAGVVGKLAHYAHLASIGATLLRYPEHEHRYVDVLRGGALLGEGDLIRAYRFADLGRGEDTDLFRRLRADGVRVYAADRFSFITIRHADATRHTWRPSDLELLADSRLAFYGLAEEHVLF